MYGVVTEVKIERNAVINRIIKCLECFKSEGFCEVGGGSVIFCHILDREEIPHLRSISIVFLAIVAAWLSCHLTSDIDTESHVQRIRSRCSVCTPMSFTNMNGIVPVVFKNLRERCYMHATLEAFFLCRCNTVDVPFRAVDDIFFLCARSVGCIRIPVSMD